MKIKLPIPEKILGVESEMMTVFVPLVVVVIVAIVGFNVIVVPKFNDYLEMKQSLTVLNNNHETVLNKVRYLQSVDSNELKKNSDFITSALLPQSNAYSLVNVVKKIADKYGFQVESFLISPGKLSKEVTPTTKTAGVSKIPIKVSLVGPKTAYLDLLKGLERSLPILSLNSFKMLSQDTVVKLDLDISAFYLQDGLKFDINALSLSDLILTKGETDLLSTLNTFDQVENLGDLVTKTGEKIDFVKHTRIDPFNP